MMTQKRANGKEKSQVDLIHNKNGRIIIITVAEEVISKETIITEVHQVEEIINNIERTREAIEEATGVTISRRRTLEN